MYRTTKTKGDTQMNSFISQDGTKIAYDKVGNGPSLILVGGAFSYRKFPDLVQLADLLSQSFTVYNYDRRGRGDSNNTSDYRIDREIEDLQGLIEAAGGSAYVWGLSSGAVLALQAAAKGVNMLKLALHEPPFVVDDQGHQPPKNFTTHVNELIRANRRADAIKYYMTKGMGVPSFVVHLMRFMPGVWSNLMDVAPTLPYDAAIMDGYMGGIPLSAKHWTTVTIPTLVLEGTESPVGLRHGAQAIEDVLPNAKLVSKKGLGHTKKLNTKLIASELTEFFRNK
jgi:pimeloyl-ACP methyl ester carboxylesterase